MTWETQYCLICNFLLDSLDNRLTHYINVATNRLLDFLFIQAFAFLFTALHCNQPLSQLCLRLLNQPFIVDLSSRHIEALNWKVQLSKFPQEVVPQSSAVNLLANLRVSSAISDTLCMSSGNPGPQGGLRGQQLTQNTDNDGGQGQC